MRATLVLFLLLFASAGTTACTPDEPPDAGPAAGPASDGSRPVATQTAPPASVGDAPYDFQDPDVSFALPRELREISGMTLLADGRLGVVQDEDGLLFALNPATGAVEARYPFGGGGDYEGVERVGDAVYVLRSDGLLVEMAGPELEEASDRTETRTFETGIDEDCDAEGLGFDAASGRFLIACKEEPGSGLEDGKAVYAYDRAAGRLSPEPVFVIDDDEVDDRLEDGGVFKPSAVAVHPTSGEVYVLSATRKALVVLGADGGLRHVWPLPDAMFEQPEGLAFGAGGVLFVSSEGDDGPAMLYRFDPRG